VCSFDAPGFGWSERAKAISFQQTAIDLHTALHNALVDGPYVLVGHSNGGLVAQAFIHLYRDQVVGVVFDDSVSPKESVQFPKRFETSSIRQQANGRLWRAAQYRGGQLAGNPHDLFGLGCATNVSFSMT
jgi:pimeloyl-ACP methyl ester carboxylesterase